MARDSGRALGRRTVTLGVLAVVAGGVGAAVRAAEVRRSILNQGTAAAYPGAGAEGSTASGSAPPRPTSEPSSPAWSTGPPPTGAPTGGLSASTGLSPSGGVASSGPGVAVPPVSRSGLAGASRSSVVPATPTDLPRGGRTLFPRYRLVGYSGGPGAAAFGRLGIGDLDTRIREIESVGSHYGGRVRIAGRDVRGVGAQGREVLPVLELIAVVAQRFPGDDRMYRVRIEPTVVDTYLAAARRHRALLLLNVQPGRAAFLDEVRALERWLVEPDVGVALDPEWAVDAPAVPGAVFGHVTGAELDAVDAYLANLVAQHRLPEKVMVVHQLAPSVIRGLPGLRARPGVVAVLSVDGIGTPAQKSATWRRLVADLPPGVRPGFKLFFDEDTAKGGPLMSSSQVLALGPVPDYVLYE